MAQPRPLASSRWPTIRGSVSTRWAASPASIPPTGRRVEDALTAAGASGPADRKAYFSATLCLAHPDGRDRLFVGRVDGTIVWPPRGNLGHGFDPVFMPTGYDITFGEMTSASKNGFVRGQSGLSHRARAFALFVDGALGGGVEQ